MIITTDGFVWLPISEEQAIKIFNNEIEDIYVLCDDEADWLIESIEEITEAIQSGCQVCLEVDHLSTWIKKEEAAVGILQSLISENNKL